MLEQIVSLGGALLVLIAFTAQQFDKMKPHSMLYLTLNLVGATILTVAAIRVRQMGLTLMEASWSVISLVGLVRAVVRSPQGH